MWNRRGMQHRKASLSERFHHGYQKVASGCWEWVGATNSLRGYGIIYRDKKACLAHRISWELYNGPTSLCVLHKCDNRRCVNPEHLFTGDRTMNNMDRDLKGRCQRGERSGRAKLTEGDVTAIRTSYKEGLSTRELSTMYPVTQDTIRAIVSRDTWTHIP